MRKIKTYKLKDLKQNTVVQSCGSSMSMFFGFFFGCERAVIVLLTAVDLVTSVYGEMNVLLHLVFCFVECGKVKQARKIVEVYTHFYTISLYCTSLFSTSLCHTFIVPYLITYLYATYLMLTSNLRASFSITDLLVVQERKESIAIQI